MLVTVEGNGRMHCDKNVVCKVQASVKYSKPLTCAWTSLVHNFQSGLVVQSLQKAGSLTEVAAATFLCHSSVKKKERRDRAVMEIVVNRI